MLIGTVSRFVKRITLAATSWAKEVLTFFRIELALKYKNIVLCIKSKYGCIYKYLIKVSPQ